MLITLIWNYTWYATETNSVISFVKHIIGIVVISVYNFSRVFIFSKNLFWWRIHNIFHSFSGFAKCFNKVNYLLTQSSSLQGALMIWMSWFEVPIKKIWLNFPNIIMLNYITLPFYLHIMLLVANNIKLFYWSLKMYFYNRNVYFYTIEGPCLGKYSV